MSAANQTAKIKPVRRTRVSDEVVVQLTHLILDGQFTPDQKLPAERELARQLGINRTSLREALRRLETMGLLRIRPGDGVFVRDTNTAAGLEFVKFLLENGIGLDTQLILNLAESRRIVGAEMIRLAAARITPEQLAALETIVADYPRDDPAARAEADFAFFHQVAQATGNLVFVYLLNTLRDVVEKMSGVYMQAVGDPANAVKLYAGLIEAFGRRDGKKAARLFDRRAAADDRKLFSQFGDIS
ncbi:MAG: FadR/GntR family transcriptional regulator [Candidatus Lernaella stagnicola]|nr:FadR/GntR family transcriptional regulator [Candidatus Lernaella stagnicola]